LDLSLLVHAEHEGRLGWIEVEADDVATLSMNSGSLESLKVSVRWGCSSKACQTLKIAADDMPVALAN